MAEETKSKSSLATVGMVLGIVGICLAFIPIINFFAIVLAIVGLVFGIVGLSQTKGGKQEGRGMAITAIILSCAAIVISILMYVLVFAAVDKVADNLNKAADKVNNSLQDASGDNTASILKNDVNVEIGKFTAADDNGITTTELPVTLTNKTAKKASFSIEIEAVDASGKRITQDTVYASDLGAGQSQDFKAFQLVDSSKVAQVKDATFKVVSASMY